MYAGGGHLVPVQQEHNCFMREELAKHTITKEVDLTTNACQIIQSILLFVLEHKDGLICMLSNMSIQ